MNKREERRYPRYDMETAVLFHLEEKIIPATMIDISKRGIGVICEQEMAPGTEADILIKYIDDYTIHGPVRWTNKAQEGSRKFFRIGIKVDSVLVLSDMDNHGLHERYEKIKDLFSDLEIEM